MKLIKDHDTILKPHIDLALFTRTQNSRFITQLPTLKKGNGAPSMVDLVIIGAGLVGVALAARAWHLGFQNKRIAILDCNEHFLENFNFRTRNIDQKLMRSTYKHHLAPSEDLQLSDYARLKISDLSTHEKRALEFERLGERALPALDLFLAHSKHVIESHNLEKVAYQYTVKSVSKYGDQWIINKEFNNPIVSKYVIFALGNSVKKEIELPQLTIPTYNALETNYNIYLKNKHIKEISVVGSGNTAAHIVLNAILGGKKVNWILRNREIYRYSDIPHEYWRTEGLESYNKLSLMARSEKLEEIYHGSAMPEHFYLFKLFKRKGLLEVFPDMSIQGQIGNKVLLLSSHKTITSDAVIVANGIKPVSLPKIYPAVQHQGIFPVLDDNTLEIVNHTNLYVASSQSALSLGPASKNIDGARLAIERIFMSILMKESTFEPVLVQNKYKRVNWGTFGAVMG